MPDVPQRVNTYTFTGAASADLRDGRMHNPKGLRAAAQDATSPAHLSLLRLPLQPPLRKGCSLPRPHRTGDPSSSHSQARRALVASRWADEPPRAAPGPAARPRRSDPLPRHLLRLPLRLRPPRPLPGPRPRRRCTPRAPRARHATRPVPTAPPLPAAQAAWEWGGACGVRGRGPSRPSRPDWWGGSRTRKRAAAEAREGAGAGGGAGRAYARPGDAGGWRRRERARRKMAAAMLGRGAVCAQPAVAVVLPRRQARRQR